MYDYQSKSDMALLAVEVRRLPAAVLPSFSAMVIASDLMRCPAWYAVLVRFACWVRRRDPAAVWHLILSRVPEVARSVRDDLALHIERGKDLYDPRSAGGLCKEEVARLIELIRLHTPATTSAHVGSSDCERPTT